MSEQKTPNLKNLPAVKKKSELPTIAELFEGNIQKAGKTEALNALLNHDPYNGWIKKHPFIKQKGKDEKGNEIDIPYQYLPIDKIEYLLRKIFKRYRIRIMREGVAFNGVYCVVRVYYLNPTTGEMDYHEGIGACQLQTKKGTSPADLINVNNGAISMAFPIAKTVAIKDACDHFGKLFGCDLNRKDTIPFEPDTEIIEKSREEQRKELLKTNGVNV